MKYRYFIFSILLLFTCLLSAQSITDSTDLEAFMDGIIPALQEEKNINGVTVSIVNDTSIIWIKGYGYAGEDIPVDPGKTLFRIGSVSKLFVWTAVMQLYEDGKLNLDADIRDYITDFTIPDNYEEPINIKNLMTHTPGFEDYYFELFSTDSLPPPSLGEELSEHMPARVRPPGVHSSYSNHGTAMAAYIVEKISGLSWDEYVEKNILFPLGMDKTSFRYQLPEDLFALQSKGFTYGKGEYIPKKLKGIPLAPAGLATSTAENMAHFMMAHLNNGKYKDFQLLDSSTVSMMHSTLFTHDPDLRGMCYGFFDLSRNNRKIIGHGGATEYFFSYLKLLEDDGYGIFISTNTKGGTSLISEVTNLWVDRYFPDTLPPPEKLELDEVYLNQFTGQYLTNRRPVKRITKLFGAMGNIVEVNIKDGNITTTTDETNTWYPIDSTTFRSEKSTTLLSFDKDEKGQYKYLYIDSSPHTALERIPFLASISFHSFIFITGLVLGLLALLIWFFMFIIRKQYKIRDFHIIPLPGKWIAILSWGLLVMFTTLTMYMMSNPEFIFRPLKTTDYLVFTLPILFIIAVILQVVLAIRLLNNNVRLRSKLFYLLLTIFMILITSQMFYWNFIGYKF